MTDTSHMLLKFTDVAAGFLAFAMASLIAAPFLLILAAPFAIGW